MDIIRAVDSYTEVSPSGRGIRMLLFGALPAHGRKKGHYENYETGRYVTITGHHLDGTPQTILNRQDRLLVVHKRQFGEKVKAPTSNGAKPHAETAEVDAPPEHADRYSDRMPIRHGGAEDAPTRPQYDPTERNAD